MNNIDEILRLLSELPNIIEYGARPLPEDIQPILPEGSITLYVREFKSGAGINGTDRDNVAEIYLPPYIYEDQQHNNMVIGQMTAVLAEIDVNGVPEPTFDKPPIIPPTEETGTTT